MLAVAAMVACSTEQTVVAPANNDAIGFDTFVDKTTRADDVTTETIKTFGFGVYASVTNGAGDSGLILDNEEVTYDGAWSYDNTQYWVAGNTYNFAAFAPAADAKWTYTPADDSTEYYGTAHYGEIYFDNRAAVANQDLVFAYANRAVAEAYTSTPESVKFTFGHMLSRVRFSFANSFQSAGNIELVVSDVHITDAYAEGTLAVENGAPVAAWTPADKTLDVEFGDAEDTIEEGEKQSTEHFYLIPNAEATTYKVTFNVTLIQAGVEIDTYEHEVELTCAMNRGGSYDIKTSLTPENTSGDDSVIYPIVFEVESIEEWEQVVVAEANDAADIQQIINEAEGEVEIVLTNDIDLNEVATRAAGNATIVIPAGKVVTIDLNGKTLYATETATKNYEIIKNQGTLTVKNGNMWVEATVDRDWNAYSAVIANTVGGNLTVENVTLEHKGGTDMAYGIDNLTNGKGTYAVTTIKNSTVKSNYRAVRQFLNGVEATNEMYVEAGAILEGANKSIFFHDPSNKANTGKLVVAEGAQLKGDVYLFVTAGSTEWPVEVSIASSALVDGSKVTSGNVPAGYDVVEKNGNYVVEYGVEVNGNEIAVSNAGGLQWIANQVNSGADYFEGKTIVLTADIDLKGAEWTPIGSAYKDHGFMGNFNGNGFVIKNLAIKNITPDSDGYVYAGLFGVTEGVDKDNQNYIKNLVIENVNINTNGHIVAAAIAYPYYTKIENVTVQGNISIKGGDYTAGVLAYTRRCVDAKDLTIAGNNGSAVEGRYTVGGVISDIQTNGGLVVNYSNFAASGLTVKGDMHVGGISGIIGGQTLDGATVKNVTIECDDNRKGIVAGSLGETSTIKNRVIENVTGATNIVGATYKDGSEVTNNGDVYTK